MVLALASGKLLAVVARVAAACESGGAELAITFRPAWTGPERAVLCKEMSRVGGASIVTHQKEESIELRTKGIRYF
jgi:hypothetical protein